MKTKHLFLVITLTAMVTSTCSAFSVTKNTVVSIEKNTQLKIVNLNLHNNGRIIGDTASLLILSTTKEKKITGETLSLASLKIAGDIACEVPMLSLSGDLVVQSGVMNIGTNRLIVQGDLLGENEKSYVTASSGTIEKPIAYLSAGRPKKVLGLEFTPLHDVYDVTITRSHTSTTRTARNANENSAKRVYSFQSPIDATGLQAQALPHELVNVDKPALFVHDYEDWKKSKNKGDEFFGITEVSIFAPDGLHFPKVITPNEATNNTFKIIGLDEYANARLTIISKGGQILYDLHPYTNDFNGENLPDGTYYYLFSEEADNAPMKKSFFEIVR